MVQAELNRRAQARRLAFMAVVAVLLATVVAASISDGGPVDDDPRASFTFAADNGTVVISHYGGDELDSENVYVELGTRRIGNLAGTDGAACTENLTHVAPDSTCRVPNAASKTLLVVWENDDGRRLVLDRRGGDPTPTPTLTATATPTPTPVQAEARSPSATETDGESAGTATPSGRTATSTNSTGTPSGTTTETPGGTTTATPDGTATATPDSNTTGTPGGTATATPGETNTATATPTPTPGSQSTTTSPTAT